MSDPTLRFAGPDAVPAKRTHAPLSADLLDMAGCAKELGICRRSLERLLRDPDWPGPRPFRLSLKSRKQLFLARDVIRYRDAVALLNRPAP